MNSKCQAIVFSNKAYNAIIDETFKKDPIETGGVLLGHILSEGYWIVMEVIPPGRNSTHQYAYFEYDTDFVNYVAQSVASQYEQPLSLLGLWHRHPGSMDVFSQTDDGTNQTFASLNEMGAISGLVNVDPKFRLTMRHVSLPLHYDIVDFEVGDDLIPEDFFKLKHFPQKGLHPSLNSDPSKKAFEPALTESKSEISSSKSKDPISSQENNNSNPSTRHTHCLFITKICCAICVLALILNTLTIFSYSHSLKTKLDSLKTLEQALQKTQPTAKASPCSTSLGDNKEKSDAAKTSNDSVKK